MLALPGNMTTATPVKLCSESALFAKIIVAVSNSATAKQHSKGFFCAELQVSVNMKCGAPRRKHSLPTQTGCQEPYAAPEEEHPHRVQTGFCTAKSLLSLFSTNFVLQTSHLIRAVEVTQGEFIMERCTTALNISESATSNPKTYAIRMTDDKLCT